MPAYEFYIGPHLVPGVIQKVEVKPRQQNWQVQAGAAGGIGAATIWRGLKIDEDAVSISTLITDDAGKAVKDADDAVAIWTPFLTLIHPNPLVKPPAWSSFNPLLVGHWPIYETLSMKSNNIVPFRGDGLSWLGVLLLIEYKALKRAPVGPPDPAKLDDRSEGPADAAEREITELVNKALNG